MNKFAMTAIAAALAFSAPVFAEEAHHPEKAGEATSAPAQPAPQVKKMQDNVKKMPAQLDRIAKAKTAEARQKAMAEHMQTMQENMKMAHEMKAGMIMDCPMMAGGMMGKGGMGMMGGGMMGKGGMGMMGGGAAPADAPDRMQQMEKRMDMMQMMMEQMMRRPEGAASAAPMPMK